MSTLIEHYFIFFFHQNYFETIVKIKFSKKFFFEIKTRRKIRKNIDQDGFSKFSSLFFCLTGNEKKKRDENKSLSWTFLWREFGEKESLTN